MPFVFLFVFVLCVFLFVFVLLFFVFFVIFVREHAKKAGKTMDNGVFFFICVFFCFCFARLRADSLRLLADLILVVVRGAWWVGAPSPPPAVSVA